MKHAESQGQRQGPPCPAGPWAAPTGSARLGQGPRGGPPGGALCCSGSFMPPRSKPQPLPSPSPSRAVEPPRGFRTQPISTQGRAGLPLHTEQRPESSLPAGQATRSSAASTAPLSRSSLGPRRTFCFCRLKICISLGSTGEIPTGKHSQRKTHKSRGFLPHRSPSSARTPRTQKTTSGNMLAFAPGVTRPFPRARPGREGAAHKPALPDIVHPQQPSRTSLGFPCVPETGAGGVGGMLGAPPAGSLPPGMPKTGRTKRRRRIFRVLLRGMTLSGKF